MFDKKKVYSHTHPPTNIVTEKTKTIYPLHTSYTGAIIICSNAKETHESNGYPTQNNQRTTGPLNAHLPPGPGIYSNAFIHVYSPRTGADNPLGTNVDVNRKPLSLCPFVASFKTISLMYDFIYILNDFIHVYSPRVETDNPLGWMSTESPYHFAHLLQA